MYVIKVTMPAGGYCYLRGGAPLYCRTVDEAVKYPTREAAEADAGPLRKLLKNLPGRSVHIVPA